MEDATTSDGIVQRVEPLPANAAWYLVGALSLASMVAYVDRQILVLLFGPIKQAFGLSVTQVSPMVPLAAPCLWLAIKPFRESLADADAGFVRSY